MIQSLKFIVKRFIDSKNYDGTSALQRHYAPPQRAGRSAESNTQLIRNSGSRDATRKTFVLDVHHSIEVGGLVHVTNVTNSGMVGRASEDTIFTCNIHEREVVVLHEIVDDLGHLVIMGLRKENHLQGV